MPGCMAKGWNYLAIKKPICIQVVIIRKKTGEIRLCIDFRKLNAISIWDPFPLPRIQEALQAVQAAIWFSSFDLAHRYLQMAMEEGNIQKTAFRAGSSGLYEFTRMPFGFTNTRASFCQLMEMCIGDQQCIALLFYLDDICVFTETAQYKIWTGIMKKSNILEFNWTEECQTRFNNLKQALITAPVLTYPDYSKSFILETDASLKGLGTVLSQRGEDGAVRVIAYESRSLRPGEKSR